MTRLLLGGGAFALVAAVAVFASRQPAAASKDSGPALAPGLTAEVEAKNPWTSLKLNDAPDQFQFAVVSDRTGGHRAKVFSTAVQRVNLLQPSFVMSVGDLVEGYTVKDDRMTAEWDEFDSFTRKFAMPFFYVPGNHDLTNPQMVEKWKERYGRRHYHFVYKNALFLVVNSEDPPGKTAVSAEQRADIQKALADNPGVRWTFVFLHKPIWVAKDLEANGWAAVEQLLAGRKYTVFCGHVHRYQKYVRNGMSYYQLATTGGGSRLRGTEYGEFDHVAWVTMKADGPTIANVMLDGILPEDLKTPESDEPGVPVGKRPPAVAARVSVTRKGEPLAAATVTLHRRPTGPAGKFAAVADTLTGPDGSARFSSYAAFDGAPAGEYVVTVTQTGSYREQGDPEGKNQLPAKYAAPQTSPLTATVTKDGPNDLRIELPD